MGGMGKLLLRSEPRKIGPTGGVVNVSKQAASESSFSVRDVTEVMTCWASMRDLNVVLLVASLVERSVSEAARLSKRVSMASKRASVELRSAARESRSELRESTAF